MKQAELSIIIPAYNVAPYLRRCLDSVTGQTYRDLEIVLVDDGSTDGSGAICDEYAARDPRIRVIHKGNGGVSSARNAGLKASGGRWIGWVDSDDWIEPDMFESLLEAALRHEADVAVCSRYEHFGDSVRLRGWERETLLDREGALEMLLKNETMQNYVWDKLWRRELFAGISFPEGYTFEDIAVMYRLLERAERVACLPGGKYHYCQRPRSIVGDVSLKNQIHYYLAAKARLDGMRDRWPQFTERLEGQCAAAAINIWCTFLKNDRATRRAYRPQIEEIAFFSRAHYRYALKYVGLGLTGRIAVRMTSYTTWWAFVCARACGWLYKLRHGREL